MKLSVTCIILLLLGVLAGCCSLNRSSLRVVAPGNGRVTDSNEVALVVGDAVESFGFRRREEHVLQSDLVVFSLTSQSGRDALINVIVDRKTLTITVVEYRQQQSVEADRVKTAIEAHMTGAYQVAAQFKELPCSFPWP